MYLYQRRQKAWNRISEKTAKQRIQQQEKQPVAPPGKSGRSGTPYLRLPLLLYTTRHKDRLHQE